VLGLVAKLRTGLYTPEATTWVKIKNLNYSQMEGRRECYLFVLVRIRSDSLCSFFRPSPPAGRKYVYADLHALSPSERW
jgi:hypothetical protein